MYRPYIYSENEILTILLEHGKEVRYKNQVQGFGLNDSDFDKEQEISDFMQQSPTKIRKSVRCSRRIFGYRKSSLLKRKLIIKLRYRGHKTSYYSITPLGISYLCNQLTGLTEYQAKRILDILRFFYESRPFPHIWWYDMGIEFDFRKVWHKLEKTVLKRKLLEELRIACALVKIESEGDRYIVTCSYPLNNMMCPMEKYLILSDKQASDLHSKIRRRQKSNPKLISSFTDIYRVYSEFNQKPKSMSEVDLPGFHYWISLFILYAFHYNLVKSHSDTYNLMLTKELELKSEVKGKKIKKIHGELNKIGLYEYEVLQVARQFSNHLGAVIEENLSEIDMFRDTLEMFESGKIPETPIRIRTAPRNSKTLNLFD